MWLGLLVFAFVLVVGLMTKWRVHSQVCDQHLAALPSPHDASVKEAAFGHGSILFQLNNFYHLFFFWIRRPKREVEKKKNALPTPVPTPRCVEVLREWTASVADTYRLQLFGRRCVVTSAPAFARRVLHTHFKLYEKNPKGDSNTQFPPALAWFIGYDGLFTRADQKDRAPHASQRISFARALLRDVETPSVIRAAVRRAARGAEGSENPAWYTTTGNSVPVVTLDTLCQFAVRCTLETLLGDTSKYLTPTQVNSLTSTLADVVDEVETELETPWRDLWIRISPRCRALKKKLHAAIAPCVDRCLEDALKPRAADGAQAPPNALEAYLPAEIPTMPADTKPKVLARIHAVFRKNLSSEVLTALLKAHMAMGPAVAWAAHYAALPQMHSLVRAIRNEATSAPGDRTAAAGAAGATEAIREVLRLHPPVPVISRVVLHDDMVAVPDLSVPLDKFWHEAAAEQDSVTRTSFVQRSGCLVVPSSSVVVINMDVLLKRTDLFGSDAAEFQPKRFLLSDETAAAASAGAAAGGARNSDPKTWFLSGGFGIGARGCPASHWALPVAAEMLREVLRDHNLTVRTGGPSWSLAAAKL